MRLLLELLGNITRNVTRCTGIFLGTRISARNIPGIYQSLLLGNRATPLPAFTDFSDFLGRIFLQDYYFTWLHVFFSDDVLRRNQIIKEVVLVEASSILPLPRRSESYQDKCSQLDVFEQCSLTLETSPDKKTGVGSLHSPRECDGRLPPDAGYYLDLVLPRSEESRKKNTCKL